MPPYVPPPVWETAVTTIITNPDGHILWQRDGDSWRLPGGAGVESVPPWQTAVDHTQAQLQQPITLTNLSGVYPAKEKPHMSFAFTAVTANGSLLPSPNLAYFPPGAEPANCLPAHKEQVADALSPADETTFRFQEFTATI
jgi:hypothetical protein